MIHQLENNDLQVFVQTQGAEISSVKDKTTGKEYIWQADPAVWARHAPVLFPAVGRLRQDQYRLNGQTYSMAQHGFARDKTFETVQQERYQLAFELQADAETRQQYPFSFSLRIIYQLLERRLAVRYEVTNRGEEPMPFTIGAHPAFNCPAQIDHHWEEYQLLFEKNETQDRHFVEEGLLTGQTKRLLNNEHVLPLHRHLFENDAVIFKHINSDWVSIVAQSTGKRIVTVDLGDFPYVGIWQKLGADFYCIEPWHGLADTKDFDAEFTEKEEVKILQAGEQFATGFAMEFHKP